MQLLTLLRCLDHELQEKHEMSKRHIKRGLPAGCCGRPNYLFAPAVSCDLEPPPEAVDVDADVDVFCCEASPSPSWNPRFLNSSFAMRSRSMRHDRYDFAS